MTDSENVGSAVVELSRRVGVDEVVADGGRTMTVHTDEQERAALARRFGLIGIEALMAEVRLWPTPIGALDVRLRLSAAVNQRCVVTLEPVAETLDEAFTVRFSRDAGADHGGDDGARDEPLVEAWPGAELDVGELVAQHLALALNPYPRAPGATAREAVQVAGNGPDNGAKASPFAALQQIRDKMADG